MQSVQVIHDPDPIEFERLVRTFLDSAPEWRIVAVYAGPGHNVDQEHFCVLCEGAPKGTGLVKVISKHVYRKPRYKNPVDPATGKRRPGRPKGSTNRPKSKDPEWLQAANQEEDNGLNEPDPAGADHAKLGW